MKEKKVIVFVIFVTLLIVFSCAEEITKGTKFNALYFTAETVEWTDDELFEAGRDTITRSAVTICDDHDIPLLSDDGEVFTLSVHQDNTIEDDTLFQGSTRSATKTSFTPSSDKIMVTAFVSGDGVADYPMINNEQATLTANGSGKWKWTTPSNYTWPSPTQVITFYGVYPPTNDNKIDTNNKFITVNVPTTADSQQDLLVAATNYLNLSFDGGNAISLPFKHVMTAVKINTGTGLPNMTIQKIELKNFRNSGTYTVHDGKWSLGETTADFSVVPANTSVNSTENRELVGGSKTFMMLPQPMTDDMEMVITATYSGKTRTLRANFSGMNTWQPGQTVTYTLGLKSGSGYYLYPTDYVGNNNAWEPGLSYWPIWQWNIYMTSYKLETSGASPTRTLLPWKVTHYARVNPGTNVNSANWKTLGTETLKTDNNITCPKVTFANNNASTTTYLETTAGIVQYQGSGYYESTERDPNNRISIRTQNPRPKLQNFRGRRMEDSETMTAAPAKSDYDLSTKGGTIGKTTANCYIVTSIGTYKFPTVYGNGYKNGSVNYQSFLSTNAASGTPLFKDYLGNDITKPDITVPSGAKAVLLWISNGIAHYQRDVNEAWGWQIPVRDLAATKGNNNANANANVTLKYEDGYIYFTVQKIRRLYDMFDQNNPPQKMEPGNAVIGLVTSDGKLIWAWHIYMAKDELGTAGSSSPEDRNLGQIYRWYNWDFADRYIWFKAQQYTSTEYTATTPAKPSIIRFRLYYNTPRSMNQRYSPLYKHGQPWPLPEKYLNGNYFCSKQRKDMTVRRNEITDFFDASNGCDFTISTYLGPGTGRWLDAKKTIYDPCPVGWRVPPSSEYAKASYKNPNYSASEEGWVFPSNNNQALPSVMYGTTWYHTSTADGSNCKGLTFTGSKAPSVTSKAITTEGYIRPIKE